MQPMTATSEAQRRAAELQAELHGYHYYEVEEYRFHIDASWFPPPSCGQNLLEMFVTLLSLKHLLCRQVDDHVDIFLNYLVKFCLNNMANLHQLTSHIMPSYTHKMAIVW